MNKHLAGQHNQKRHGKKRIFPDPATDDVHEVIGKLATVKLVGNSEDGKALYLQVVGTDVLLQQCNIDHKQERIDVNRIQAYGGSTIGTTILSGSRAAEWELAEKALRDIANKTKYSIRLDVWAPMTNLVNAAWDQPANLTPFLGNKGWGFSNNFTHNGVPYFIDYAEKVRDNRAKIHQHVFQDILKRSQAAGKMDMPAITRAAQNYMDKIDEEATRFGTIGTMELDTLVNEYPHFMYAIREGILPIGPGAALYYNPPNPKRFGTDIR